MTTPPLFYRHPRPPGVRISKIMAGNLHNAVSLILSHMMGGFSFVAVDTQFPGEVHRHPRGDALTADERYGVVKANADELRLLQMGITLCDAQGRLPVIPWGADGGLHEMMWEVDFCDFDARLHRHVPESVEFLRSQGFDFLAARHFGVPADVFAAELHRAGILRLPGITWVTFGGMYDAAFMFKLATFGAPLPESRQGLVAQVGAHFGPLVFDGKYMALAVNAHGSLAAVGEKLGLPALEPNIHMAGPNSLMAIHVFMELRRRFVPLRGGHRSCSLQFYGL
uniref:poly(A)-specific ribonuclease n=2 Tax=Oryza brachyantha TaxID=4533 RepID=J3N0P9_ORYBR